MSAAAKRVFIALDFPSAQEALKLAEKVAPLGVGLKMGLELFTSEGPALARDLAGRGDLFLDLKYHDIPATVGRSVAAATRLGVAVMNLHTSGGEAMVRAAVEARDATAQETGATPPGLIGVTVLTSLDGDDLRAVWGDSADPNASAHAVRLAERSQAWGLDGVVASAKEAEAIRAACGPEFLIVTPGIRPAGADVGDQKRVLTPAAAIRTGASHLVIGRPVTRADDPHAACAAILNELAEALA
ncbi:MAG: orotidine-5'-phosphate decarboxylase [bacterium]|nr:orotidine-5'-phosphate decarboxylase [bacterium]